MQYLVDCTCYRNNLLFILQSSSRIYQLFFLISILLIQTNNNGSSRIGFTGHIAYGSWDAERVHISLLSSRLYSVRMFGYEYVVCACAHVFCHQQASPLETFGFAVWVDISIWNDMRQWTIIGIVMLNTRSWEATDNLC